MTVVLIHFLHELRKTVFFQGKAHAGNHAALLFRQGGCYSDAFVRFVDQGPFLREPKQGIPYGSATRAETFGEFLFANRLVEIKLSGDQIRAQCLANCVSSNFGVLGLGGDKTNNAPVPIRGQLRLLTIQEWNPGRPHQSIKVVPFSRSAGSSCSSAGRSVRRSSRLHSP